jgi:isopentenyl phosphate kinase
VCIVVHSAGAFGDYTKEYIKAEIPTNKEEEVRKYYQEVKR